jgi:hypothetical protein
MDIQRIRSEVARASQTFAYVEGHPTSAGGVFVKVALQTSVGNTYFVDIKFDNYPNVMPKAYVTRPVLSDAGGTGHYYVTGGYLCYMHPTFWNPGRHDLTFVIGRVAKWLNKYEVWKVTRTWPGEEHKHAG